ncbi:response regulator [Pelagovum pacificum]|uniref:Response regulator n=1 Tax=Pelagovum pacificum TaxID=2588711 RepID=A0A5C5GCJ0_9RHOB|nr:response regulator [Pelagovum pacificum]TNY31684.1 response regulator [Pelagovum pacificum]
MNIILVEDDDGDAKALTRAMAQSGFADRVIRAVDGVEALALLRRNDISLDRCIMLVDLNMPRMSGLELVSRIRADDQLRRAIIFIMSTSDDERDLASAYDNQVAGYIMKRRVGSGFENLIALFDSYRHIVETPKLRAANA